MSLNVRSRLPLFIVLLIFVACRIPYLHYAYYWDESWPYAVAIKQMYHHGISLMPGAIDPELSRGHPLFFHAIAAMWMGLFGSSHIAMHSFALLITVLFLALIYETGLRLFDQRMAILAVLLVATQEVFFVQSAMVLFEMLVAFLSFLSLVFYVKEKYILTALCLCMLFYTKESGLIMGFILGIDAVLTMFNDRIPPKQRGYKILSVALPCLSIGVFFLIQKHLLGWYVFPLYSNLVPHEWVKFWYPFRICCMYSLFVYQYRFYYFILLLILAIIAALKQRTAKLLIILLPAICIYYFVDDTRAGRLLPGVPFFLVFLVSTAWFLYEYSSVKYYPNPQQRKLIRLSGLFILCFLCFSALNFFTPRYLLAAMVPLFFIIAAWVNTLIGFIDSRIYYVVICAILITGTYTFTHSTNSGDADLGSFNALELQQDVVDYFEKNVSPDDNIYTSSFLESQHLQDPATGFLRSSKVFKNTTWKYDRSSQYLLFDNIENDARYNELKANPAFVLVIRLEKGKNWAEIYKRK